MKTITTALKRGNGECMYVDNYGFESVGHGVLSGSELGKRAQGVSTDDVPANLCVGERGPPTLREKVAASARLCGDWLIGIVTVASMFGAMSPAHAAYQPNVALSVVGNTPALVQAKFTTVMAYNFERAGAAARLAKLSDREWQAMYYSYQRAGGNIYTLDALVARYAPASYAHVHYVSREKAPFTPPSTGLDNTFTEIYLDFRTAPYGGASVGSALLQTSVYGAFLLKGSYDFGQIVGSKMAYLISTYDPPLWEAIGYDTSLITRYATEIGTASSSFLTGLFEVYMDSGVFDVPLGDLGSFATGFGDFGLMDDIQPADLNTCLNPGMC